MCCKPIVGTRAPFPVVPGKQVRIACVWAVNNAVLCCSRPLPSHAQMSAPAVVAPDHEPATAGQVLMLVTFGCSFVVLCIWQTLLYLSHYFPFLAKRVPPGPAPVADVEADGKEKEHREPLLALDRPATWLAMIHNDGASL